jgi:hypothetical protein
MSADNNPHSHEREYLYARRKERQQKVVKICKRIEAYRLFVENKLLFQENPSMFSVVKNNLQNASPIQLQQAAEELQEYYEYNFVVNLAKSLIEATEPRDIEVNITIANYPLIPGEQVTSVFQNHPEIIQNALSKVPEEGVKKFLHQFEGKEKLSPPVRYEEIQKRNIPLLSASDERTVTNDPFAPGRMLYQETCIEGVAISHFYPNQNPSTLPILSIQTKPLR